MSPLMIKFLIYIGLGIVFSIIWVLNLIIVYGEDKKDAVEAIFTVITLWPVCLIIWLYTGIESILKTVVLGVVEKVLKFFKIEVR